MLRPLPLVFLFVYYEGHGAKAKSTPVRVGCYKIFFSQLYHDLFFLPQGWETQEWTWKKLWTERMAKLWKGVRQPQYMTTTKNVFHLWVSGHNLWSSDLYFLIYITSLLYRKVRIFQKNLVELKQWLMHVLGYHIYATLSKTVGEISSLCIVLWHKLAKYIYGM